MRYDKQIFFRRTLEGEYDESTGDYGAPAIEEHGRLADVQPTGTETMMRVFGQIRQDSVTVHIQEGFTAPFDCIRIGDVLYQVAFRRKLRAKETFVLREILQGHEEGSV